MRCAYRRCNAKFTPVRIGQRYCRDACRVKDWRNRRRRAPTALSAAFECFDLSIPPTETVKIVGKLALEWLEDWMSRAVGMEWNGRDFVTRTGGV